MDLSIIIINWNTKEMLQQCIESIRKSKTQFSYEIIIIDNGSDDGSKKYLKKARTGKVIYNTKNIGMAAGINQGSKIAKSKNILLLHPDTKVMPESIDKIIKSSKKADIFGVNLIYPNNKPFVSGHNFPTIPALIIEFFPNCIKKLFHVQGVYIKNLKKAQPVDIIPSACFFFKKAIIKKIGPFDERFNNWCSEWDFCYRAKKAGFKIWYLPITTVIHFEGMTFSHMTYSKKMKYKKYAYVNTDRMLKVLFLFYRKHYGGLSFMILKWLSIIILEIKIIRWFYHRERVKAYVKSIYELMYF